jgi:kynurenine formamidase
MKITFEHAGVSYDCDSANGHSLARDLRFLMNKPAEEKFIPPSMRAPFQSGSFVGAIESQGSCNVDRLDLIPHCHGTHTETALHIINYQWSDLGKGRPGVPSALPLIADVGPRGLLTATLITVVPVKPVDSTDSYRPNFEEADRILTGEMIKAALAKSPSGKTDALIIRTDANNEYQYDFNGGPEVPYLSVEAMGAVNEFGCRHLLVDLPSVDRLQDDGHLTAHHLYWNIPEHEHQPTTESELDKTITEMIVVEPEIKDGFYLLNLQTGPLISDASPSRPVLYPVQRGK